MVYLKDKYLKDTEIRPEVIIEIREELQLNTVEMEYLIGADTHDYRAWEKGTVIPPTRMAVYLNYIARSIASSKIRNLNIANYVKDTMSASGPVEAFIWLINYAR